MGNQPDPNLIFGYQALAQVLGISPNNLHVRKHRKQLEIEPLYTIGRLAVFDRAAVLKYKARQTA
ncbi:hypothetical protein [Pusillimonas noertemannii]|uniref:DNA-binding protein n=1 Tax=Pusillimonas noertemannii TaxID=305977 RepID=A0A2U1CP43_9BURK|nr:hypothetical protein [Pusillimonas noertemannii]NYT68271.1 hypothetical protein [Pusillimonas noertemannii]PVY62714.1 hypothetical protein C7440_2210 [Pusillimonas noertemannii]TFL10348.1 hypothetical protein CSC72_07350 [Pusillimonas noertemannii]